MAATLHVNGLATITFGSSVLGYTVDGVTIDFIGYFEDVYTDLYGPRLPTDVLLYGEEARVSCDLIVYDTTVLAKAVTRWYNGTEGYTPNDQYGHLLMTCSGTTSLQISKGTNAGCGGTEADLGYIFNNAYLTDNHTMKLGTRVTRHQLTFRCLPEPVSKYLFHRA